ncbi:MAG TPA: hypothetical protein VKV95_04300 [Terriglobia bacterium]|nr:hypothetical protein [Terriglobia bacterium]
MRLSRRLSLLAAASLSGAVILLATTLFAADNWNDAASEFAAKILARAPAKRAIALSIRNISSLGDDDVSQIRRQLRSQMRSHGAQLNGSKQAGTEIHVTLSENSGGYIWVADIRNGSSHDVAMINVARPALAGFHPVPEPLSIRKTLLYSQTEPMLAGVFFVHPAQTPSKTYLLVLGVDSVSLYEEVDQAAKSNLAWTLKQSSPIRRSRPVTRDFRGRLEMGHDYSFNVYLPGETCSGVIDPALKLDCRDSDTPWPYGVSIANYIAANFNPDRNFFDGRIQFSDGRAFAAPPFYSVALLPLKSGDIWLLAGIDGRIQLLNSNMVPTGSFEGWGSNIAVIQSNCQEIMQALATLPGDYSTSDAVQAINLVDGKGVPASAALDFGGPVTELWSEPFSALAISHNLKTSTYELSRLSVTCGQ